jgi:hypothetical protein
MTEVKKIPLTQAEIDTKKRKILFKPCKSEEELRKWILLFLELDMPNCIVDPDSNCTPLGMIWEVYSKALQNNDPDFDRVLYYASRSGMKTLSAAILEVLAVFHLNRDVGHMAALEGQARKCQNYVKDFLNKRTLIDFKIGDNLERIDIVHYWDKKTDIHLTEKEWRVLSKEERDLYEQVKHYIKIVVCTLRAANGDHFSYFCVDGDTEILQKNDRKQAKGDRVRFRKRVTARGIFSRLAGRNTGGNPSKVNQQPEVIENPVKDVELMSLNLNTGFWEFSKIVRAQCILSESFKLETEGGHHLTCSDTHPLYILGKGFKLLSEISIGDKILKMSKAHSNRKTLIGLNTVKDIDRDISTFNELNDEIHQVILGSVLGDCGIYRVKTSNPYLSEQHCLEQEGYLRWKWGIISRLVRITERKSARSGYTGKAQVGFYSANSPLLLKYHKIRTDLEGIETLGPQGLAIWYMDDGCAGNHFTISTECFTKEQNDILAKMLWDRFKIKCRPESYAKGEKVYWRLIGGVDAKRKLAEYCLPYIHPDLAYKFNVEGNKTNCKICGREYWFIDRSGRGSLDCGDLFCRLIVNQTFAIDTVKLITPQGEKILYDFTLENNHNYVSNYLLSHNCVDEIDVVADPRAYFQAMAIPDTINNQLPITILTSTRKFSFGLVQKEIDNAVDEDGTIKLQIRHWNAVDVTRKCEPERCLPDLPKIPIYVDEANFKAISEKQYVDLSDSDKPKYDKHEGFQGCISNCKLFSVCKTRLYTHQKSKSPLLKPIDQTINQIRKFTPEMVTAELLCRKPSSTGLIYTNLERSIHMKTASQMAEMLLGHPVKADFSKRELIELIKKRDDWKFYSGMDFGYTHNFAVVTGAADGYRIFILDVISEPNLLPDRQVAICNSRLKGLNSQIFADPENRQMVDTLRAAGFRMKKWVKGPGSLNGGIDAVRLKLREPLGEPTLFFLSGDPGVELLFKRLLSYHWKLNAQGDISDVPDDKEDDECDAMRYLVMNKFQSGRGHTAMAARQEAEPAQADHNLWTKSNFYQKVIEKHIGDSDPGTDSSGADGSVKWSF